MAERPGQPDVSDVTIRLAETFDEAVTIHRFLLVVLRDEIAKRGPVDAEKSLSEVWRVVNEEAALVAIKNDCLIGTLGVVRTTWWFGDGQYFADRWDAVLPEFRHAGVQEMLIEGAKAGADEIGLKFVHYGKIREMKNGVGLMFPRIYSPSDLHNTPTLGSA